MKKFISMLPSFLLSLLLLSCQTDVVIESSTEPASMGLTILNADWEIICRNDEVWIEFSPRATNAILQEIHIKDPRTCDEVRGSLKAMKEMVD